MLFDMGQNLKLPESPNARLWNKSYDWNINGTLSCTLATICDMVAEPYPYNRLCGTILIAYSLARKLAASVVARLN